MKKGWLIFGGVVVLIALILVVKYNSLVTAKENIDASWSQVENVLQRRFDLIPNLVNTVKGYATHEREVFTQVTEARAKVGGAVSRADKISANDQLTSALSRLLVVAENYPDLKANQNFLSLQDELAGTENRIAVERRRYNEAVRVYNTSIQRFPSNIIASFLGFQREDAYFKADEGAKQAPKVQF